MEGAFEEAFTKAGLFSGEILQADIQFLAALRNQAESALNKKGHSASMAAHALIGMIDGRTFRDGPLTDWLESIAARMRAPKTAAKARPSAPQGQNRVADAAVPISASEAMYRLPQGHNPTATEAEPNTAPAKAKSFVPKGHGCIADAGAVPETIAEAIEVVPEGHSSLADAIVPNAAAGAIIAVPQGQGRFAPAAAASFHGDVVDEDIQIQALRDTGNGRFVKKTKPIVVQRPSRVNFAYAGEIAKTVLDTFRITMRQGSVVPIGDVTIGSLDRLTSAAGKRAWVGAREYNLLLLVKERAARQAHVPEGAKVRDIFDAATVTRLIAQANATSEGIPMIVVPKMLEPADAAA